VWLYFQIQNKANKATDEASDAHDKIDRLPCDSHEKRISSIDVTNTKLDGIVQEVYNKIDKLPCVSHGEKINSIGMMNAKLDGIVQMLQLSAPQNKSVIMSQSPIKLTDFGKQLVKDIGISSYVDINWGLISDHITKNSTSMNLYDIQQYCFNYVLTEPEYTLTKDGYDKLKSKAFSTGLSVFSLLQAVSLVIRDRYFEEHGLNVEELDGFTPTT
jgi:hypothetical protein